MPAALARGCALPNAEAMLSGWLSTLKRDLRGAVSQHSLTHSLTHSLKARLEKWKKWASNDFKGGGGVLVGLLWMCCAKMEMAIANLSCPGTWGN